MPKLDNKWVKDGWRYRKPWPISRNHSALGSHFEIDVGDRRLTYCYIRKNACSAFKKLFAGLSAHRENASEFGNLLEFMQRYHLVSRDAPLCEYDRSVFVYRDPVQRFVSLYKNKFIQRDGNADIFPNYARLTGGDPRSATFQQFVTQYLMRFPFIKLDVHLLPQLWHLRAERYTDAVSMQTLQSSMEGIIGSELASKYFSQKVNSTADLEQSNIENAALQTSDTLHESYLLDGTIPRTSSFLLPKLEELVSRRYHDDIKMLRYLCR